MKCPFKPSVQDAIVRYRGSVSDVKKNAADKLTKDLNEMVDRVDKDGGQLLTSVTELLTSQVMAKFPCVPPLRIFVGCLTILQSLLAGGGLQLVGVAKEPKDVPLPPDDGKKQDVYPLPHIRLSHAQTTYTTCVPCSRELPG